jgi:diguanylate cyclase (GGDEF)-like protein
LINDERQVSRAGDERACPHVRVSDGEAICIPMHARGKTTGLLHLTADGPAGTLDEVRQRLGGVIGIQLGLSFGNIDLQEKLHDQAVRDPLTGLYNRHFLHEWIKRENTRARPPGSSIGAIMLDVDHFKAINDLHGHAVGDAVLSAVGNVIKESVRESDLPCRYGGEEFLILIPDIDHAALIARGDALRASIEGLRRQHGLSLPRVTASIGVALSHLDVTSTTEIISAADKAMYTAKRTGRNRMASESPSRETAPSKSAFSNRPVLPG